MGDNVKRLTLPTVSENQNLLAFLTWYEEITGEECSEICESDEEQWWHWKTWNRAIKELLNR